MQLSERNNKYRKEFGEICPIEEDPQNYYAQYFLAITRENYELLLREDGQDKPSKIVDALKAYDFKSLANAEDKKKVNVTLKAMEFTQSLFKPQDLNAENVDAVMRLCAIGFYIWFRVAVENPTDLDIMMFFQAKDEDVHTNMTYTLDGNTDWGRKRGYYFMDLEMYFTLYNTDIPKKYSIEYMIRLCQDFENVCEFNVDLLKVPEMAWLPTSLDFIRQHRKWCIFLLVFAKGLWGMTAKENAKKAVEDINLLTAYAFNVFKEFKPQLQPEFREEYTLSDRDQIYERFFVSCFIFVACMEKINKECDSHEGLEDYLASNNG